MSAASMNAIRKIGPARRVALGTVIAAGLLLGGAATTIVGRTSSTSDYRAASLASRDSRASEQAIDALWRARRGLDSYLLTKDQADLKDGQLADSDLGGIVTTLVPHNRSLDTAAASAQGALSAFDDRVSAIEDGRMRSALPNGLVSAVAEPLAQIANRRAADATTSAASARRKSRYALAAG